MDLFVKMVQLRLMYFNLCKYYFKNYIKVNFEWEVKSGGKGIDERRQNNDVNMEVYVVYFVYVKFYL